VTERSRSATPEDLKRLLSALHREGAEYVLIGGFALLAHGYPRATVDIDFLVPAKRAAAGPIRRALLTLPDGAAHSVEPDWFQEDEGIRIADEIVVDLIFRTCGENYESLLPFLEIMDFEGVPLRTLNLSGLLRTKQSARERDAADRVVIEAALAQSDKS
jgi:hypothetical protein